MGGWLDSTGFNMFSVLVLTTLFAPLLGAIVAGAFSTREKSLFIGWFASLCIGVSLLSSAALGLCALQGMSFSVGLFEWMAVGSFSVAFSFSVDSISAVMIVVISFVSFFVHIYSIGYMAHDRGFNRYFSFLSGFVFSMMFLVLSDNFLGLFVGWEGVGLCSYLLIGFWYERASANAASIEAFVSNRIADLGMLLGIFLVFYSTGSVKFSEVFSAIAFSLDSGATLSPALGANGAESSTISAYVLNSSVLSWIGILLFIGAMGKSAQFPLHTWLANAMEGPTPVSALIHAATMVTAGVYLVIRAHPLYMQIPHIGEAIAYLGAFVAIFAASMAVVNTDLKRIIAYSTLSQLGYMFVAAGLGAYWVALFHLFTHAFFKSLLFLGAGNVMHAMHDGLDITRMGRLARPLKYTMILMLIGNLALCGIPPFAGYFSKDLILEFSFNTEYKILWGVLVFGAFLTAFYSFRLFMLVFFAPKAENAYAIEHPHEASTLMLCAMLPLALLAIVAGLYYEKFLALLQFIKPFSMPHGTLSAGALAGIALGAASLGIVLAVVRYGRRSSACESNACKSSDCKSAKSPCKLHTLLSQQYYIPALYHAVFSRFFGWLCNLAWRFERGVFEKSMLAVGTLLLWLSRQSAKIQNGTLTSALRLMVFGLLLLVLGFSVLVIRGM